MRYASEPVLKDLLPALDSLDLAIQYGGSDETCKSLLTGVIMTRKLLLDALKNHGFDVAGEVGEPFNPMSMMPFPMKSGMIWNPAWSAPCTSAATA